MPTNSSISPIEVIEARLAELETSITSYPEDLRDTYTLSKSDFRWAEDVFSEEESEIKGLSGLELAMIHRFMLASAFIACAVSLPNRYIDDTPADSTEVLDVLTAAGLPPGDFLHHYATYGNQFTWKLLKLTGRISGSGNLPAPD